MPEPRSLVEQLEQGVELPAGPDERFAGYGVMGLPLTSGHVLALRRFPASSVGPGYTSVWHRDAEERWTFYQNAPPEQSCPRYFGHALAQALVRDIEIAWTGPYSFSVIIPGDDGLNWQVSLGATLATRIMNMVGSAIPGPFWHQQRFLRTMGAVAGVVLQAGKLGMTGQAPNGQRFVANPRLLWFVQSSQAVLRGRNLGSPGRLPAQARLGDFWIPQRGLFVIGAAFFEPFDAARHLPATSQAASS